MKVAIITDQHFGARKNSKLFHDYFLKFYNDIFFPTLVKNNIKTVVDMGDTFDSRKGIDFAALAWAKDNYYDILELLGVTVHTIVGNHTAYYKNTNEVNAVDLLLREYKNVKTYSKPTEVELDKLKVVFIPWINGGNYEETFNLIKSTKCKYAMGHLEFSGFPPYRGFTMQEGMDSKLFNKFELVFSGHYHTRSDNGKVFYLGNPYEIYFNDMGDTRGFHIFDTETLSLQAINNPYTMHETIYYEDNDYQTFNVREYDDKIVKLVVRKKTNEKKFEKFIDKLYSTNIAELKIVESFADPTALNQEYDLELEDTVSILNKYVDDFEDSINKASVKTIIQQVYKQACEIV
jgi:DNA repair exonuclease SbcCD nuclease subunit